MNKQDLPSLERQTYLSVRKKRTTRIRVCQAGLLILFLAGWEVSARLGIIDSFIVSSPARILRTLSNFGENGLFYHLLITCIETLIGFGLGVLLGNIIAFTLWWSDFLARVAAPYLVVINALPKIALGPVIIVWVGAGMQAIIVMALAISLVVTVLELLGGFTSTDRELVKMARTLGATRWQTFTKIIYPSNLGTLFSSLKINLGLSLVGVIAGEFLVSRAGLGYLIIYGGQVFQMDLVMTSVLLLGLLAALLYGGVVLLEKAIMKVFN